MVKLGLTVGGGLAAADAFWRHTRLEEPWRGAAVIASVMLVLQLAVSLPFSLWRTFGIEARFGFNRVSPRLYAVDFAKQLLLATLLGGPLVLATLRLMERAGPWWWLWVWLIWLVWTVALTWAAPQFIAPFFNRFTPLTDEVLKRRVEALLERCGFTARGGVFVMDGSLRSAHGNAYFTGIGRNKRIVFFDTLLSRIDAVEIEAVLAHELGHFRLHHVRQRLVASVLLTFCGLALLAWLARQPIFYSGLGVPVPSAAMALLLFVFTVPVLTFFATPVMSWWSRRHERQADDFAAQYADPGTLAAALVKLFRDNASTLTPDRIHSAVLRFPSAGAGAHRPLDRSKSTSRGLGCRALRGNALQGSGQHVVDLLRPDELELRPARSAGCPRDRADCAPAESRCESRRAQQPRISP